MTEKLSWEEFGFFDPATLRKLAEKLQRMKKITPEKLAKELYAREHVVISWEEFYEVKELVESLKESFAHLCEGLKALGYSDRREHLSVSGLEKMMGGTQKVIERLEEAVDNLRHWLERVKEKIEALKKCLELSFETEAAETEGSE